MQTYLDFEKTIAELESRIRDMKVLESGDEINIAEEVRRLERKLDNLLRSTYSKLTSWQKIKVARHPDRPHLSDYIRNLFTDFMPLSGDRGFADDHAIIGGIGRFNGQTVMVVGHEKGNDTASRIKHNFGMARPEGFRKAIRLFHLADQLKMPIITFVDTAGAYPGIGAEERGQAEAIARSTEACLAVKVPLISVIVGEGGSGGAVALAVGNKVLMMEHAVYSVISPEGCASILWRTNEKAEDAANALKITAQDLHKLEVIDEVIPEPIGGAHRDHDQTMKTVGKAIDNALSEFSMISADKIKELRSKKFLNMGNIGL
ncbi:MAG: acetyl-CoA carboxylase carboxyltransferase subunit alpha [Kordiimonadaceae bacterium]|jgi:acetyl-CoA carboxylase carboxyl transferase subunit alpha|nr:acetyl-CoA carboxylase carboxyltransferase subunit alpha [Kordiimonadaceae bacterium]MDC0082028.1 acetyl-CoA carboxylase carboxyltransferase subunit alpha [Emcibacteraceae bacterium]MBT6135637.1 acetyl-CoA carboxylase carboxyltransferase subunit alpha [Kordiimonadaceae bacterium]MBT6467759.1 acetyl-CoA carboxylase carboxyltransferase subunit alpha [Kordiimonadaceae bacterium]MBT7543963.1 acetyl-CoA carboxylase carboxyltransferase subunit alpha [Kordiimonadaceae bacterium]|tara:strand:- start:23235 stop:24188 length:954 start_codon:yes stop_codon:yes gene_type:complete